MIGNLPVDILNVVLETIPVEFSVIDKNDKVVAWNKHDTRIFKRPTNVVDRNVRNCHPQKSIDKVEKLLKEMKEGTRDKARFWIDLNINDKKQKVMIEYYALRNSEGKYIGCLEATQNITEIQSLTGEKRLAD